MNSVEVKVVRKQKVKKKPSLPVVNAGATLLLAVLLVLVLSVLALLTFSAARNDYEFSRKMADKTTRYYESCNQAEQILAQVEHALQDAEINNTEPDFGSLNVETRDGKICWEVPVSEDQLLLVEVLQQSGEIVKWQTAFVRPWVSDDSVSVLQP